jgi:hypothetical protein
VQTAGLLTKLQVYASPSILRNACASSLGYGPDSCCTTFSNVVGFNSLQQQQRQQSPYMHAGVGGVSWLGSSDLFNARNSSMRAHIATYITTNIPPEVEQGLRLGAADVLRWLSAVLVNCGSTAAETCIGGHVRIFQDREHALPALQYTAQQSTAQHSTAQFTRAQRSREKQA